MTTNEVTLLFEYVQRVEELKRIIAKQIESIDELGIENEQLRKIVARAINMLDMFADKSRGKYADEARIVSNELFRMLKALGGKK